MLDNPDMFDNSELDVMVADGGLCRVEGECHFGDKPALVMSKFDSIILPADAVTDHSAVVIFENEMYVVPKQNLFETRKELFQLAFISNSNNKTSTFCWNQQT